MRRSRPFSPRNAAGRRRRKVPRTKRVREGLIHIARLLFFFCFSYYTGFCCQVQADGSLSAAFVIQYDKRNAGRANAWKLPNGWPGSVPRWKEEYPDPVCALQYRKDYELMIAVRLSAQCTDARVNLVTPALFARYPTLDAFAEADVAEVETYVHSCGFCRRRISSSPAGCWDKTAAGCRTMDALLAPAGVGAEDRICC